MKTKKVTREEVLSNMQFPVIETVYYFNKPMTRVTVKMKNGFIITESSSCVDVESYSEEIGQESCLKKIEDKIWLLLGYQKQEELYQNKEKEQIIVRLEKMIADNSNFVMSGNLTTKTTIDADSVIIKPYDKTLREVLELNTNNK